MNEKAADYIMACNASSSMREYWRRHPLQRAIHSVKATERAEVKKAYRELRKQMEATT